MLLNWVVLWNELEMNNGKCRRDPLADPLDRPEWQGLRWFVPLIARLASRNDAPPSEPDSGTCYTSVSKLRRST